jgi:flagella basal body P-ring formation protein FlgA
MTRRVPPADWLALAVLTWAALTSGMAIAQPVIAPAWQADVRAVVADAARAEAQRRGHAVRAIEVLVGEADRRLKLAPCARVEAHLPPGARAWGRTRAGLRCVDGPTRWSISVPVTVRALGMAAVATRALQAGDRIEVADLRVAEVDLAADASPTLSIDQAAVGRTITRTVAAGQALRAADLQARRWFDAGDTVRVVARGTGFAVHGTAQALNPGVEGQAARVRTENGRILSATPVGEREVEIAL